VQGGFMNRIKIMALSILLISILSTSSNITAAVSVNGDSDYIYSKAMILKSEGKFAEAAVLFLSLAEKGLVLDRTYYQAAVCFQNTREYPKALEYARKAIEANPQYPDPYQLMFDVYLTLRNNEEAADVLSDLIEEKPDLVQYHYTLGVLYFQNIENYNLAAASFKKVLSFSKTAPIPSFYTEQSNLILSDIYYSRKEYKSAILYLDDAVKINPRNNSKFYRYSTYFLTNGYYEAARLSIEKFLANTPENQKSNPLIRNLFSYLANIYYITGDSKTISYLRMGSSKDTIEGVIARDLFLYETANSKESIEALEKITTSEYSSYVAPYIALAKEYLKQKDTEKAYQSYLTAGTLLAKTDMVYASARYILEAHKLKPKEKEPLGYLAQIYEQMGSKYLAALFYSKYLELSEDIEVSLHLAYLYDVVGEKAKSDKILDSLAPANDKNPRFYFIKGVIFSRRDRFADAENMFKKAVENKPEEHSYYYYLATVQEKEKKKTDAENSLKKAIELDAQNAPYKNYLGYLYADANVRLDEAYKLIDEALKIDPFNGAYLDSLGWVYFRQGKNDIALKKLKQAMRSLDASGDTDPVVMDHIGDAYQKLGKMQKAIIFWKKAVAIKKDEEIEKKIKRSEQK
jgi:tetratricopeptide (TPR) repeat protein